MSKNLSFFNNFQRKLQEKNEFSQGNGFHVGKALNFIPFRKKNKNIPSVCFPVIRDDAITPRTHVFGCPGAMTASLVARTDTKNLRRTSNVSPPKNTIKQKLQENTKKFVHSYNHRRATGPYFKPTRTTF